MRKAFLIIMAVLLVATVFVSCKHDPETVTVTFNPGGGAGEPYSQEVVIGQNVRLNPNKFTKEGSSFIGWSMSPTGGLDYADNDTVNLTSNLSLFAVWAETYEIKVIAAAGGTLVPAETSYNVSDITEVVKLNITPDENYYLGSVSLAGSDNTSAFYGFHTLFIPMKSKGDIIITPTFKEKPALVSYIDAEWNSSAVVTDAKTQAAYSLVRNDSTSWTEGWYVLLDDVTISDRITVSGAVKLILRDGATLSAEKGITVATGATLTIYGQTEEKGRLVINGTESGSAGIGGTSSADCGTIEIKGGCIEVTGGENGAGIGGGEGHPGGTVNIFKGEVVATGGKKGAGIGGGAHGAGGTVVMYGGTVKASSYNKSMAGGAGIGGGYEGNGGSVIISGAAVDSKGGDYSAGIGGGYKGNGGSVTITAGSVTAKGSREAAGIGGGSLGNGANVTISGGTIDITGGSGEVDVGVTAYNVAIGAGRNASTDNSLTLEGGVLLEVKDYHDGSVWQDYDGSTRYYQMRTK